MNDLSLPSNSLGADIRALRKSRGQTLDDLASNLGRSVGWLSQVERDLSAPSIEDLQKMAAQLNVPLSLFFGHADAPKHERGYVVRAKGRRAIGNSEGLTESLLSPDLTDDFEMIHCIFAPGAGNKTGVARDTQEVATIIKGTLAVWIGQQRFTLKEGDSFRVRGEPFRWENVNTEPAIAIWVISPPVY